MFPEVRDIMLQIPNSQKQSLDVSTILSIFNLKPEGGEKIIGMHFIVSSVSPSVCLSVTFSVQAITCLCIDELPYNFVQMLSLLTQYAVTLTWVHTSKVKVTQDIWRSENTCLCPRYNLSMHWSFGRGYSRPLGCLVLMDLLCESLYVFPINNVYHKISYMVKLHLLKSYTFTWVKCRFYN